MVRLSEGSLVLSEAQAKNLCALLDAAVKARGLEVAMMAAAFNAMIWAAFEPKRIDEKKGGVDEEAKKQA